MRHNRIFYNEMGTFVQFKILEQDDLTEFMSGQEGVPRFQYMINVLRKCIYNLDTEVMISLISMEPESANNLVKVLFNGCIMLNPALSADTWISISYSYDHSFLDKQLLSGSGMGMPEDSMEKSSPGVKVATKKAIDKKKPVSFAMQFAKVKGLEAYLTDKVIGQPEAIKTVSEAFSVHQAGLSDQNRPIGVFLFSGPSGTGKTMLAKEMHNYIYGEEVEMLRIDCGEYQHKHENQKLLGPPPGYVGYDEGGIFQPMLQNSARVVLLDEVEKAHPDVLNTFLRAFDEGQLTNSHGKVIDFRSSIIIMTSNLGNEKVIDLVYNKSAGFTSKVSIDFKSDTLPPRSAVENAAKEAAVKFFKPEFINRFDAQVVFNFLTREDCRQIADMELNESAIRLNNLGFKLIWDKEISDKIVSIGYTTVSNARSIRNTRYKNIDTPIAEIMLEQNPKKGSIFTIITSDNEEKPFSIIISTKK